MMDFSVAYLETGFSFVTLKQESFNTWAFLEPFDTRLWLYIFFTVILVSLFMFISNFVSFINFSRKKKIFRFRRMVTTGIFTSRLYAIGTESQQIQTKEF